MQAAAKGGTKNVEAHEFYLQGRFFINRHSEKEATEALAAFQHAVELDPSFALAWAGLAQTHIWYCSFSTEGGQKAFDAHLAAARERWKRLSPLSQICLKRCRPARRSRPISIIIGKARPKREQGPRSGAGRSGPADGAGNLAALAANWRGQNSIAKQSSLDPVNPLARAFFAFNLAAGRLPEARAEYARVVELNPAAPCAHAGLGLSYLLEGKFEEAVAAGKTIRPNRRGSLLSFARWGQKKITGVRCALERVDRKIWRNCCLPDRRSLRVSGDKDKAFEWLERARRQRDAGLPVCA